MDSILAALATPGLWWVALAAFLGGLARGFSGFGSALIFLPLAGMVLPPAWAIIVIVVMDLMGPLPNLPAALRAAGKREIGWMTAGMVLGLPFGAWALTVLPVVAIRWGVSGIALLTLALMVSGWRYAGPRGPRVRLGLGMLSGVLGGSTGLAGPPVILFEMSADQPVARTRANLMVFLVTVDLALMALLLASGQADWAAVMIGVVLILPFALANMIGAALFHPARAVIYRRLAYLMIAASALLGLPLSGA